MYPLASYEHKFENKNCGYSIRFQICKLDYDVGVKIVI